jgi:hypothetical protein
MTVLLVTTRLDVDAARDQAEWWPEAVAADAPFVLLPDTVAIPAWDLVEAITRGLPAAKVYRITVEAADAQ